MTALSTLLTNQSLASSGPGPSTDDVLKRLSLDQLGTVEVTTTSKEPVSIQSRFTLPKGLEFDQTFRYVSALPAQAVKAFSTADAHISWWATKEIELSVVGENLLQPQHTEFGHDPGPIVGIKRSFYARITWRRAAD